MMRSEDIFAQEAAKLDAIVQLLAEYKDETVVEEILAKAKPVVKAAGFREGLFAVLAHLPWRMRFGYLIRMPSLWLPWLSRLGRRVSDEAQ